MTPLDDLIAATATREASRLHMHAFDVARAIRSHLATLAGYGPDILGRLVDQLQREATPREVTERATLARCITEPALATMRDQHAPYLDREHSWILRRDAAGRGVDPVLWCRGSKGRVICPPAAADTITVHSHPAGTLEPSNTDLEAAAGALTLRRTGFLIVDPLIERAYAVCEGHDDNTLALLASIYDKTPLLDIGGADGNA